MTMARPGRSTATAACLLLAAAALLLPSSTEAAGMATHTRVGERALTHFGQITRSKNNSKYNRAIQAYPEAVVAGSDFPDFLYVFNDHRHDAAEAAHWPPWQAAAAKYIRALPDFETEWSEDTGKLVAFLFGCSIHFMADEAWEGYVLFRTMGLGGKEKEKEAKEGVGKHPTRSFSAFTGPCHPRPFAGLPHLTPFVSLPQVTPSAFLTPLTSLISPTSPTPRPPSPK